MTSIWQLLAPFLENPSMTKIHLKRVLIAGVAPWLVGYATAASHGPIELEVKQIGKQPAACLPLKDSRGDQPVPIVSVGVWRATGPNSVEDEWEVTIPATSAPLTLERGACVVYGQKIDGAIVETQPRRLESGASYAISFVPIENGPSYSVAFCIKRTPDGGIAVIQETKSSNPCL